MKEAAVHNERDICSLYPLYTLLNEGADSVTQKINVTQRAKLDRQNNNDKQQTLSVVSSDPEYFACLFVLLPYLEDPDLRIRCTSHVQLSTIL